MNLYFHSSNVELLPSHVVVLVGALMPTRLSDLPVVLLVMRPLLLCVVSLKLLQCFGITASACDQSVVALAAAFSVVCVLFVGCCAQYC